MTIQIEDATRQQLVEILPGILKKALASYDQFMSETIDTAPKKFSEHHTAGKVAVAHVQLLLKLAQWADVNVQGESELKKSLEIALNETSDEKFLESDSIGIEG